MEVRCICLRLSGVHFVWDHSLRLCRLWSTINSISEQFIMISLKMGVFLRTINFSFNEKSVGSWKTMIDTTKHLAIFHSAHYDNTKDLENSNCYNWSIFEQQKKKTFLDDFDLLFESSEDFYVLQWKSIRLGYRHKQQVVLLQSYNIAFL